LDTVILTNFINGVTAPTPAEFWAADVNGDGTLDTSDLSLIQAYILNGTPLSCS